jgi:hypothetical protein
MSSSNRQLLVFRFPADSEYEGRLVGAVERIENGGAMRILSAMFVGRQADSGELVAVSLTTEGSAGLIGKLLAFRLEDRARTRATERVLASPAGDGVRSLADTLQPGEAVAGVLVEHTWAQMLGEAIDRVGGTQVVSEFVGDEHPELSTMVLHAVS